MTAAIFPFRLDREFHTSEECHITELCNSPADGEAFVARARVEPGVTTRWHRLRAGFARWEIYGDFDRRPLARETEAMIVMAWND